MKIVATCIFLFFIWSCKTNSANFRWADEPLRIKKTSELKPVMVDTANEFKVKNEGKEMFDLENQPMRIGSDLTVNGEELLAIRFAKASLNRDTLEITIFESNESSDNFYKMKVVSGRYKAQYDFSTPVDQRNRQIKTIQTKLVLNSGRYGLGQTLRGHVEFKGKCNSECEWKNDLITMEGNFVAEIE